jgi:hypothetical protein
VTLSDVRDVIDSYTGRARTVLEYSIVVKRLVDEAKKPGFTVDSWAPLGELVAVEKFERVGPFKDVMQWPNYVAFLTDWATSSEWECSFKRITETEDLVFLELEERSTVNGYTSSVNSISVYDFDHTGKITHVEVYLQMVLPNTDVPKSLE